MPSEDKPEYTNETLLSEILENVTFLNMDENRKYF